METFLKRFGNNLALISFAFSNGFLKNCNNDLWTKA